MDLWIYRKMSCKDTLTAGCVSSHFPSAFIFTFVEHFGWMQHSLHEGAQQDRMHLLRGHRATFRILYRNLFNFTSYTERPLGHVWQREMPGFVEWVDKCDKKKHQFIQEMTCYLLKLLTSLNNWRVFKLCEPQFLYIHKNWMLLDQIKNYFGVDWTHFNG